MKLAKEREKHDLPVKHPFYIFWKNKKILFLLKFNYIRKAWTFQRLGPYQHWCWLVNLFMKVYSPPDLKWNTGCCVGVIKSNKLIFIGTFFACFKCLCNIKASYLKYSVGCRRLRFAHTAGRVSCTFKINDNFLSPKYYFDLKLNKAGLIKRQNLRWKNQNNFSPKHIPHPTSQLMQST